MISTNEEKLVSTEELQVEASDGFKLSTTCFTPHFQNKKIVLIGGATGVYQNYYKTFAEFLATEGFVVYTFDYRGVGRSRPKALRGFSAKMHQWGTLDTEALILHIRNRFPEKELVFIGHSVAGQILGLTKTCSYVSKIIFVGSQLSYSKLWPKPQRIIYLLFLYTVWPGVTHICGYFPGKFLKIFWDLPKGVALEWAKWCKSERGLYSHHSDKHAKSMQIPILAFSFENDLFAPFNAVVPLLSTYCNCNILHAYYSVKELGGKEIGHFGFFKRQYKEQFWYQALDWIK